VFERAKTTNIKRPEEMRGIKRHIKRDDLLCFTIFFKID
jgi:hypothetical protein